MKINNFTIRVYALIINEYNEILLSDEFRFNQFMTKFPGGGLEYGEGIVDCLKREIKEELNESVIAYEHFYTTDFFQKALFFENLQLIGVYYLTKISGSNEYSKSQFPSKLNKIEGAQVFRWAQLRKLTEDDFSFPIDKKVVKMLKEKYI